jgi:hypothetical protein
MRLSAWRTRAPLRDALGPRVLAVVEPVLAALGAEPDPHAWIVWGDDPGIRYPILVPSPAGLIVCHVRVNVPGEGPRASAKLVRWSRVQLGELAIETQANHRLITFQVEGHVLRAADAEADAVAEFAVRLFAGVDGRPVPEPAGGRRRSASKAAATLSKAGAGRKPAAVRTSEATKAIAAPPTSSRRAARRATG